MVYEIDDKTLAQLKELHPDIEFKPVEGETGVYEVDPEAIEKYVPSEEVDPIAQIQEILSQLSEEELVAIKGWIDGMVATGSVAPSKDDDRALAKLIDSFKI
jgi:hypothetical protein